jgi:hypothetical protein
MADERRLRIGPWVDNRSEAPEDATGDVSAALGNRPRYADDVIELPTTGVPLFAHDLDHPGDDDETYRGQRRAGGHPVTPRRLVAVAIMVGALLIGVGLMSRSVAPDPVTLLAPPPTPPELASVEPTSAAGTARLVPGPTGEAQPNGAGEPSGPPAPAPAPPPGGGSGPAPPAPTTAPSTPPIASYEAENANRGAHTEIREVAGASGGRVVEFTTGSPNQATVEHPDVSAGAAGTYRLTIHYLTHTTRSVTVSVNGGPDTAVSLPAPGDAETVGAVTLSVHLGAGANTVLIRNGGGPGLRLDRVSIAE